MDVLMQTRQQKSLNELEKEYKKNHELEKTAREKMTTISKKYHAGKKSFKYKNKEKIHSVLKAMMDEHDNLKKQDEKIVSMYKILETISANKDLFMEKTSHEKFRKTVKRKINEFKDNDCFIIDPYVERQLSDW